MADRTDERLRELFEELGYSGAALDAMVAPRDLHDPAVAGRELFTEAQASRFAQDVGPATASGSLVTALTEIYQRRPFSMAAVAARGHARTRILAVAAQFPGRADLAEAELRRLIGLLRVGNLQAEASSQPRSRRHVAESLPWPPWSGRG